MKYIMYRGHSVNFMQRQKSLYLIVLLIILTAGCALHQPIGPIFNTLSSPQPGKALIYFYRQPGETYGYSRTYFLKVNNQKITEMQHGGYYPYDAIPGHLSLVSDVNLTWDRYFSIGPLGYTVESTVGPKAAKLDLDVESGQTYYVKLAIEAGTLFFTPHLYQVSKSIGESEIRECKLIQMEN